MLGISVSGGTELGGVRARDMAGLGVGLSSKGQGLLHLWFICTGHARCYQEEQPESTVWRLLYSVDAVVLRLGRHQWYLMGDDWGASFDVNLPGP